jgi:oligoribonuclease (3'-5' exoribonuclease)
MDFQAGPLVWIDCEMTGLDPRKDKILEIAVSRLYIRAVEHFLPNVDRTLFGVGVDHGRRP